MLISQRLKLDLIHSYLMHKGFPYHSVSVVYRPNEIGYHVFIMSGVKELITDDISLCLSHEGFNITIVQDPIPGTNER